MVLIGTTWNKVGLEVFIRDEKYTEKPRVEGIV